MRIYMVTGGKITLIYNLHPESELRLSSNQQTFLLPSPCADRHTRQLPILARNVGLSPRQMMDFGSWEGELHHSPDTKQQRSSGCPGRGSLKRKRHRVKASLPLHLKSRCFFLNHKLLAFQKDQNVV